MSCYAEFTVNRGGGKAAVSEVAVVLRNQLALKAIGHGRSVRYSAGLRLGKASFKAAHLRAVLGCERT